MSGSPFGRGAPTYENADLAKSTLDGRLAQARRWSERYAAAGDAVRAAKWARIADELLDRRLEVRGL